MIPKIIHYCWLGEDDYPQLVKNCIASWKKFLPDYEFMLWDKKRFDVNQIEWVKQAYEVKKFAFAADYIRFYALYNHGGIYLDADVQVLKTFNDLLHAQSFIGLDSGGSFEAATIGAEKGTEWLKVILDQYTGRTFINESGKYNITPLPILMQTCLEGKYGSFETTAPVEALAQQLTVYPSSYFSPKDCYTKEVVLSDNSYSIHHYDGHWIEQNTKLVLKDLFHKNFIRLFGKTAHQNLVSSFRSVFNRAAK